MKEKATETHQKSFPNEYILAGLLSNLKSFGNLKVAPQNKEKNFLSDQERRKQCAFGVLYISNKSVFVLFCYVWVRIIQIVWNLHLVMLTLAEDKSQLLNALAGLILHRLQLILLTISKPNVLIQHSLSFFFSLSLLNYFFLCSADVVRSLSDCSFFCLQLIGTCKQKYASFTV